MSRDSCPLPGDPNQSEQAIMRRLIMARRIAVVGLSDDSGRASYSVASYLLNEGKEIIPVNPRHAAVLGLKCYGSLEEVPGKIDLVDVFRRAEFCPDVVRAAIKIRAGGIWLQSGIVSPESRKLAIQVGIDYVEDRCLMVDYRHFARANAS